MPMLKEKNKYLNYAINNDCSKCKYGQDGYYGYGLYFCNCKKKFKKHLDHNCNKYKEVK